jgi:hypothetical protein
LSSSIPFSCRRISALLLLAIPALCFGALSWTNQKVELTAKPGEKEVIGLFRFVNSGNTTITVTDIKPGCGCTTAELIKRTYAPGEAGEIKAVFTIGDRMPNPKGSGCGY